jgi:hypothetical protein
MFFPQVDLKEWLARYPALRVTTRRCYHCRRPMTADIPFIEKHWIGLQSEDCVCGKGKAISVSTPNPSSDFSNEIDAWLRRR